MSNEQVLVTGASGFIGAHTSEALGQTEREVRGFRGDMESVDDWKANLRNGDIVYLIAGVRTESQVDFAINAHGIENLFTVVRSTDKLPKMVILASSQAVYMGMRIPFKETDKSNPTTTYGRSKLLGETIATRWCNELGIPLVILRYSTVLGSGVRERSKMSGPLFIWAKAASSGEPIKVFQDGNQTRDYIHVDDVVSANLLALDLPSGIYNVGGGEAIKVKDLAEWIKNAAKSDSEIIIVGGEPNEGDPRAMFSDTSKLTDQGWRVKKTANQAVEEFVAGFG